MLSSERDERVLDIGLAIFHALSLIGCTASTLPAADLKENRVGYGRPEWSFSMHSKH